MTHIKYYFREFTLDLSKSFDYTVILSNDVILRASFTNNKIFRMKAFDFSGKPLVKVELSGHLTQKRDQTSIFKLEGIQNEDERTSQKKTGIATIMLQLLATFIADYNELNSESDSIKEIQGTIVPIGNVSEDYLKDFYLKKNCITDIETRIKLLIDFTEFEHNNLVYYISSTL